MIKKRGKTLEQWKEKVEKDFIDKKKINLCAVKK